ncbi:MAG: C1 family peptidase [Candidatus Woesearchaeota archaeon]
MKKIIVITILIISLIFLNSCKINEEQNESKTCQEQNEEICYNHQVCDGSILTSTNTNRCCLGDCKLPKSFNWRDRHNENWMTPVKNQGNNDACYSFAIIGAIEAHINLYYNQHLDVDLAEQFLEDCINCCSPGDTKSIQEFFLPNACENNDCGSMARNFCRFKEHGIILEECDPYSMLYRGKCTYKNICSDWQNKNWKINDYEIYVINNLGEIGESGSNCQYNDLTNENEFKKILIENGPIATGLNYMNHAMVLSGYETNKNGQTMWIFKNSRGLDDEENGYKTVTDRIDPKENRYVIDEINPGIIPLGPYVSPTGESYDILCVDKDNDNFCNWGITEVKPSTCPQECEFERDWDDSDSNTGALGLY